MNTRESSEHKGLGLLCFLEIEKEISRQLHTHMLAVIFCTYPENVTLARVFAETKAFFAIELPETLYARRRLVER